MKSMKILSVAIFIFLSTTTFLYGKFDSKPPIKWGQISQLELDLKKYDKQPGTPAVILCDYGNIEITNRAIVNRHVRIKILSEEGINYTSVRIPYIWKNEYDDIVKIKAQVINVDKKGNLRINKLASFEFSKEIINDEEAILSFTFSDNVRVGSIIEYQYEIASLNVISFDDWFFQNGLPTLWSEIRFDTPEQFTYLMTYKKGQQLSLVEKRDFENQLDWLKATKLKRALRELHQYNNVLYQTNDKRFVTYVINQQKKKIVHKDLPGFSKNTTIYVSKEKAPRISLHLFESHGLSHPIYKPVVFAMEEELENKSKFEMWHERYPAGYVHYRLPSWDKFNEKYLNNERFGMQLVKHVDYIPILNDIVSQELDNVSKAKSVYSRIKSTIKWDGSYSALVNNDLSKVIKKKEGNSAELNLLLTYLFKRSGLNAYPVLVKSKFDGTLETSFPAYNQFNHVIVAVQEISGKVLLFDLTASHNKNSIYDIYEKGWAVKKIDYGWLEFSNSVALPEEDQRLEHL